MTTKKGTTNAKNKVAVSQQGTGGAEPSPNYDEVRPGVLEGAERVRAKATHAAEAESGDSYQDIPSNGRSDTSGRDTETIPQARRETPKRLTKSAVARLRGEDKPEYEADPPIVSESVKDMSVGQLQEMYEAEQAGKNIALKSYHNGYNVGYKTGVEDEKERQRQHVEDAEIENLGRAKVWHIVTAALAGSNVGIVVGVLLSGF